jgi:hypothetical protein
MTELTFGDVFKNDLKSLKRDILHLKLRVQNGESEINALKRENLELKLSVQQAEDDPKLYVWETPAKSETERKQKIKQFESPDSKGYDFNADVIGGQSWYFLKNSENKTVAECTTKQIHGSKIYQIDDVLVPDEEQRKGYCVILITKVFRHYYDTNRSIRVFGDANIAGKCYRKAAINLETIGATFDDNKDVITATLIYSGMDGAGKNIKHKYKKRTRLNDDFKN